MVDIERVLQSDGGGEEAGVEEVAGDKREEMTRTAPWGIRKAVEALDKAILDYFCLQYCSCQIIL